MKEKNRRPASWAYPYTEKPDTRWFHPAFLWWVFRDIAHQLRSYAWHKRRSLSADRWALELQLHAALLEIQFMLDDDEISDRRKENLKTVQRNLFRQADELGIESEKIERYRGDDE